MTAVVIVGAGHGGVQVADSLRARGYDGAITLLDVEPTLPYQRPPLSKDFMHVGSAPTALPLRAQRFFDEQRIDLRTGVHVIRIEPATRELVLESAARLSYSELILATGAATRALTVPGAILQGVMSLRTLADAERLRAAVSVARRAVVVGAGFIGLEFAAGARKWGVEVTVLEMAPRPMARGLTEVMSEHFAVAHREMGTEIRFGERLVELLGDGERVQRVVASSGCAYAADLVLLGVGVRPRDDLARKAGLQVADGIVVDEDLRTSDPHIFAVGDCVNAPGLAPGLEPGSRMRLESVQNATDQGRRVAEAIVNGASTRSEVPWFWSTQGDLRLQIAGVSRDDDAAVVNGNRSDGRFSVLCFRGERLVAVESLNSPADHMAARRLLASTTLPTLAEAIRPDFNLKDYAKQVAAAR